MRYINYLKAKLTSIRKIILLSGSNLFIQLIPLITIPILSRLYAPEHYGALAIFMSIGSLLGTFATLFQINSVLIAENNERAKQAISLSFYINTYFNGCVQILLFIAWTLHYFETGLLNDFPFWILLIPYSVYTSTLYNILSYWFIRNNQFKILSFSRILNSVVTPLFTIGYGLIQANNMGLIWGMLLGQTLTASYALFIYAKNHDIKNLLNQKTSVKSVFSMHKDFTLFGLPAEVIGIFTNQLPVYMLKKFGNNTAIGLYNMGSRLLEVPVQVVSLAVGDNFKQMANAEKSEHGHYKKAFRKSLWVLLLTGVPGYAILYGLSPEIFKLVFGPKWIGSSDYLRVMCILYLLTYIVNPLNFGFMLSRNQKNYLGMRIVLLLSTLAFMLIAYAIRNSLIDMLTGYVVAYSCVHFYSLFYCYKSASGQKNAK